MANIIKKLNPKMRRVLHTIFKVILVLLGTFILAFGTGIFLVPFNIITGGVKSYVKTIKNWRDKEKYLRELGFYEIKDE